MDPTDPTDVPRRRMVEEQLARRDIKDPRVLDAIAKVPRHEFVPPALRRAAYNDNPLPIGYGQTISQPFIVAYMTQELCLRPTDRVLEVGTGSGYQTAILACLAAEVFSVEIIEALSQQAEAVLKKLGFTHVRIKSAEGQEGWREFAPFDAIIVTCATDQVPPALVQQLKDGGRMIIPLGQLPDQSLTLVEKQGDQVSHRTLMAVRFVPMTRR